MRSIRFSSRALQSRKTLIIPRNVLVVRQSYQLHVIRQSDQLHVVRLSYQLYVVCRTSVVPVARRTSAVPVAHRTTIGPVAHRTTVGPVARRTTVGPVARRTSGSCKPTDVSLYIITHDGVHCTSVPQNTVNALTSTSLPLLITDK